MAKLLKDQQGKVLIYNNKAMPYPEPSIRTWFYPTEYDSNGYPIKAKTIGCSGNMLNSYRYGAYSSSYQNVISMFLQEFEINKGVTSIGYEAFEYCVALKKIKIPSSINSINSFAFRSCSSCLLFDLRDATFVPTLSSTSAFEGTPSDKKIVVPDSLYDSWITATNWSSTSYNIVSSIIKASEYEASL